MINKIKGCIIGAAIGDAMGAPAEAKSPLQIQKTYNGKITDLVTPDETSPSKNRKAGEFTDAFSIPYELINLLIQNKGEISKKVGEEALINWSKTTYFPTFAGMTTKKVINNLINETKISSWEYAGHLGNKLYKGHYYALSSNGAGVKSFPIGLINHNNIEKTIQDTVEITMASHDDPLSISGACAISAAIAKATDTNATIPDIIDTAIYASKKGEQLARQRKDIWTYPGPSVTKRIELAQNIILSPGSKEERIQLLADTIGSGPAIAETVPVALAIFALNKGQIKESIIDAINLGDESSAIGSITGSLAGTYKGYDQYCEMMEEKLNKINNINLSKLSLDFAQIINQ